MYITKTILLHAHDNLEHACVSRAVLPNSAAPAAFAGTCHTLDGDAGKDLGL